MDILSSKPTTILQAIASYVNSEKFDTSDELIYRPLLISHVLKYLPHVSISTIDNTRNYLTLAGYLITISSGQYSRLKKIPHKLTINKLFQQAYPPKRQIHQFED